MTRAFKFGFCALTILLGMTAAHAVEVPSVIYPRLPTQADTVKAVIPKGWHLEKQVSGNLNKDDITDRALLDHAQDVTLGGEPRAKASIRVIFNVNAPYGAKLFKRLQRMHPDTAVLWVPIAYFHADSATIAAAIIASVNPAASLQKNVKHYDFPSLHGSYPLPDGSPHVALNSGKTTMTTIQMVVGHLPGGNNSFIVHQWNFCDEALIVQTWPLPKT